MRILLVLLGLMVVNVAQAIDCRETPNCADLGFSQEEDPNCVKDGYIKCPFDTSYKKCVQHDCEKLGFTESDKSLWCASVISCKSNSAMTLCQKPCIATTYDELKELASSGKCKLLTIKNDIIIPENQGITLHAETIIDGGNHTITSSGNKENLTIFSMNNKSGIKNIKLRHTQTQTQVGFVLLRASVNTDPVSLENMDIVVSSNDNVNHWTPVLTGGTFEISGKFALDVQALWHMVAFSSSINFTDAQVSVKITGMSGDMLVNASVTFTNSTFYGDISGYYFTQIGSVTFKNSTAELHQGPLFWGIEGQVKDVLLDGSSFTSEADHVNTHIIANITLQNASVLNLTFKEAADKESGQTNIITTNTTDTLVVNDQTYRPTKAATTLLSEVEKSGNWEKASQ